ncbi:hypothetical protein C8T65DRAFT_612969 [Cerioporus squamosus]|nr:hypothetical protein C8T65DRAFT_612969 [Cerioporus squamosus]
MPDDTTSTSARKRARTASESRDLEHEDRSNSPGSPLPISQDPEFWFEDGTISLVAGRVEFRLYRGLLGSRSPVFADMFSFPQPATPVTASHNTGASANHTVSLTDSPQAFRELLRVLTPDTKARLFEETHPTCFTIASLIRLGHKYQMDDTVDQSLRYLSKYFPRTLDEFRALDDFVPPEFEHVDAVAVINLARLTGATHLLPVLVLICCHLDGTELVNGVQHCDGSRDVLSPTDLARCIDAKTRLCKAYSERIVRRFRPVPPEQCRTPTACDTTIRRLESGAMFRAAVVPTCNPFQGWLVTKIEKKNMCTVCWDILKERDEYLMQEMWKKLPTLTGVGEVDYWGVKKA